MRGERALLAAALAALTAAVGGCGSNQETVRIGVLTDCQGPFASFEDAQLSGAELPFLGRGARLIGTSPSGGVTEIELGGRRVELVRGCQESGEHTVYIEEARRLLETEHVDVVVGGASVVARDLAHRYPDAVFVSTFWDEPEVTLRHPAANLFRFSPDYAQQAAGLGAYAYRDLGWRRAAVVAGMQTSGWAGAAAFTAEFCALGGRVVSTSYRSIYTGKPNVAARALSARADGVATFLNFLDDPAGVLGALATGLHDPHRLLVWPATLEDSTLIQTLGKKLDGVVGTSVLPSSPPSPALRDYRERYRAAYPGLPAFLGDQSFVVGYHDAVEATLTALGRVGSGDVRVGLMQELARIDVDLPDGEVTLDRNRQAVRDGYLSRVVDDGGKPALRPVRVVRRVEQSFGGLLSTAPPSGPGTQSCRKATPPAWAR
jgi:ABC-type branched-subunit amino acid transport system substrate-binding protein